MLDWQGENGVSLDVSKHWAIFELPSNGSALNVFLSGLFKEYIVFVDIEPLTLNQHSSDVLWKSGVLGVIKKVMSDKLEKYFYGF